MAEKYTANERKYVQHLAFAFLAVQLFRSKSRLRQQYQLATDA
jgi:hypothetical protein